MTNAPSFVSEPQVTDLVKLLADVRSGYIQVPRFQRPFVWEDDRRLELLRSIRIGIPIGSLLVWRTSQQRLRCFEHIAGVPIPRPGEGQTISYLLDGHQRVTTLFAAFDAAPNVDLDTPRSNGDDTRPSPLFFDLVHDDFVVGPVEPDALCIPVYLFLNAVLLRRFFRDLERQKRLGPEEVDRHQGKAEALLYAIQWCRIPVVPLTTDDVELATRSFHRVNSQGAPMTEVHMVAALTWGDTFDLRKIFEDAWVQVEPNLPHRWKPLPEQQVLNILKGLLNMEVAKASGDLLVRRIKDAPEKPKLAVELLGRAMHAASKFVSVPASVPYQMQLILTAVALHDVDDNNVDHEQLRRWWGLTTVWGSFGSAASHRVQAALRHLKATISGGREPWPNLLFRSESIGPLPALELRNARARYFVDGYAQAIGKTELLEERGSRALISLVRTQGTRAGNRFLWAAEDVAILRTALETGNMDPLSGHFIDEECIALWQKSDGESFVMHREALMNDVEKTWFDGLHPAQFIVGEH